ncbi:MAG: CoA transferase [Candidatus Rokubacteria bacterium]|nr:CoA transferase [Candidatus Rokubacteria bacterium]MBI4628483.1 CoA transferase [Candidatus Rokubacteria bacterium]
MTLPLEGVVVADLTQNVAGPFCTQILGDMGAAVIKVERPGRGDDARAWAPPFWGAESAAFMAMNRNKKSLALDVKREGGLEVLKRLVARAEVFVQSLRAGAVAELGLDFAAAAALNPRLVYCSVTAYGARGPLADRPGYDPLMQAYGGLMSVNGHPGQEPARVGTSIVDMGTGMWAALGIVAALRQRDATGRAVEVTTALFETALMWVSYHAMGYLGSGEVPQPQGSGTAMIAPYQAFPTADGYAMIAAGSDALYGRLARALGAPGLADDPRFADNPSRVRHRAALVEALAARTRELKTVELLERLRAAGVPSAPILTVDAVLEEPQTRASGMLVAAPHPRLPDYRSIGLPILWDGARPEVRRVPPRLGEHSADVLTWLGYTLDDIRALRAKGVIE